MVFHLGLDNEGNRYEVVFRASRGDIRVRTNLYAHMFLFSNFFKDYFLVILLNDSLP